MTSHGQGAVEVDQEERVEELTVSIPDMWADHHVLTVREALSTLAGVKSVEASAKERTVKLLIDPAQVSGAAVTDHLAAAGYPPGEPEAAHDTPQTKPEWAGAGIRVTRTNPVDLKMSGDHRKY